MKKKCLGTFVGSKKKERKKIIDVIEIIKLKILSRHYPADGALSFHAKDFQVNKQFIEILAAHQRIFSRTVCRFFSSLLYAGKNKQTVLNITERKSDKDAKRETNV